MKRLLILISIATFLLSCKSETKDQTETSDEKKELNEAKKVAQAHGFEKWKDISSIAFTFQVERNGSKGNGRSWIWFPKKDSVVLQTEEKQIAYNRKQLDSVSTDADRAFINDKFWLLVPFQMVWDEGTTISETVKAVAPISKTEMNKLTLTYGNEGGYTPGDAYDIFFDEDYILKEWVFRQGNVAEPTITTTFENYQDFNGIKIAKDHKMEGGNFNIMFSGIAVN